MTAALSSGIDSNVGWLVIKGYVWLRESSRRLLDPEGVALTIRGLSSPVGSSENALRCGSTVSPGGIIDPVGVVLDEDEVVAGLGRVDDR